MSGEVFGVIEGVLRRRGRREEAPASICPTDLKGAPSGLGVLCWSPHRSGDVVECHHSGEQTVPVTGPAALGKFRIFRTSIPYSRRRSSRCALCSIVEIRSHIKKK